MMSSREKTLAVMGPPSAGKTTLTGSMLFKYGGIDMLMMQRFQDEGIHTYDQASRKLKNLNIPLTFDVPNYHVTILENTKTDCAILVVAPDLSLKADQFKELATARQLIIVINKMDSIGWSEAEFRRTVENLKTIFDNSSIDIASVPVIPISAFSGDNLVELSAKCSWYKGWKKNGQGEPNSGTTLLEALDVSFAA